jgi:hypothetical protein
MAVIIGLVRYLASPECRGKHNFCRIAASLTLAEIRAFEAVLPFLKTPFALRRKLRYSRLISTGTTMTARFKTAATFLRIFCAVVLFSLGFAHRPVQAAPVDAYSEAYRLPDGTFADICSEGGHSLGDHGKQPFAKPLCEVCLLSASVILPPPDDGGWLIGERASLDNPLLQFPALSGSASVEQPRSRAPPNFG